MLSIAVQLYSSSIDSQNKPVSIELNDRNQDQTRSELTISRSLLFCLLLMEGERDKVEIYQGIIGYQREYRIDSLQLAVRLLADKGERVPLSEYVKGLVVSILESKFQRQLVDSYKQILVYTKLLLGYEATTFVIGIVDQYPIHARNLPLQDLQYVASCFQIAGVSLLYSLETLESRLGKSQGPKRQLAKEGASRTIDASEQEFVRIVRLDVGQPALPEYRFSPRLRPYSTSVGRTVLVESLLSLPQPEIMYIVYVIGSTLDQDQQFFVVPLQLYIVLIYQVNEGVQEIEFRLIKTVVQVLPQRRLERANTRFGVFRLIVILNENELRVMLFLVRTSEKRLDLLLELVEERYQQVQARGIREVVTSY